MHMWGQGTAQGELCDSKMNRRASTGTVVPNDNYFKWIAADKEIVKSVSAPHGLHGRDQGAGHGVHRDVYAIRLPLPARLCRRRTTAFMATKPEPRGCSRTSSRSTWTSRSTSANRPGAQHRRAVAGDAAAEGLAQGGSCDVEDAVRQEPPRAGQGPARDHRHEYMKDTTLQLNRKVEDLEDVRHVMAMQQDIRVKESEIDTIMTPIEESVRPAGQVRGARCPRRRRTPSPSCEYSWSADERAREFRRREPLRGCRLGSSVTS